MKEESVPWSHRACHTLVRRLDQRHACRVGVSLAVDLYMVQPAKSVAALQDLQTSVVERAWIHCHSARCQIWVQPIFVVVPIAIVLTTTATAAVGQVVSARAT